MFKTGTKMFPSELILELILLERVVCVCVLVYVLLFKTKTKHKCFLHDSLSYPDSLSFI